jgi:hypothetical protein
MKVRQPPHLDQYDNTTTNGERFYGAEHANLAWLIHKRFGRNFDETLTKWRQMLDNDCDDNDLRALINYGRTMATDYTLTGILHPLLFDETQKER